MENKVTIKSINEEIARLETERAELQNYRDNIPGYRAAEVLLAKQRKEYFDSIRAKDTELATWIRDYKKDIAEIQKAKQLVIEPELKAWFKKWQSGVHFGYEQPKIVWISDDKEFVIITIKGGTAGQGTAMGTGGYYYANTDHRLAYTKSEAGWSYGNYYGQVDGRLTNEAKQSLINQIPEFKEYIKENAYKFNRR